MHCSVMHNAVDRRRHPGLTSLHHEHSLAVEDLHVVALLPIHDGLLERRVVPAQISHPMVRAPATNVVEYSPAFVSCPTRCSMRGFQRDIDVIILHNAIEPVCVASCGTRDDRSFKVAHPCLVL